MLWTDGKVELLLDTVKDFKAEKSTKLSVGCPLKTSMSKLKKGSLEIFLMARKVRNTHIALVFRREHIASKIKQLRSDYRKTLHTQRESRGGRLVAFFHDKLTGISSGSPATESVSSGNETHENGANNIETDENTAAENKRSKNAVPNDYV